MDFNFSNGLSKCEFYQLNILLIYTISSVKYSSDIKLIMPNRVLGMSMGQL